MKKGTFTLEKLSEKILEFEKESWVAPKDQTGKTRHITLHMGKLLGSLSEVSERREHDIEPSLKILKEWIIPDLLIYSLMLSNLYKVDLEKAFLKRIEYNKKKVKSWKKK